MQFDFPHIHRAVIAPSFGSAVGGIVLNTGRHRSRIAQVVLLIASDHRSRYGGRQEGILPVALGNSPPAGIAGNIYHRREIPHESVSGSFSGRNAGRPLDEFQVPGARYAQGYWKDGLVAVDHIHSGDQGDT